MPGSAVDDDVVGGSVGGVVGTNNVDVADDVEYSVVDCVGVAPVDAANVTQHSFSHALAICHTS